MLKSGASNMPDNYTSALRKDKEFSMNESLPIPKMKNKEYALLTHEVKNLKTGKKDLIQMKQTVPVPA